MRKNLLSLVALAGAMLVSTSAFAQWAEPTPPALQEVNATEVESGKAYFIKNVGPKHGNLLTLYDGISAYKSRLGSSISNIF